jgi:hypothetical protein
MGALSIMMPTAATQAEHGIGMRNCISKLSR